MLLRLGVVLWYRLFREIDIWGWSLPTLQQAGALAYLEAFLPSGDSPQTLQSPLSPLLHTFTFIIVTNMGLYFSSSVWPHFVLFLSFLAPNHPTHPAYALYLQTDFHVVDSYYLKWKLGFGLSVPIRSHHSVLPWRPIVLCSDHAFPLTRMSLSIWSIEYTCSLLHGVFFTDHTPCLEIFIYSLVK